ncbi:MAG: DUF3883 domain-containing protein [Chloroflexi bacterium]|nr:DUF3883 domain-containing protein [Chloroflexota bacterium]
MALLKDLTRGAIVKGILPDQNVTVVDVQWYGTSAVELTYKDAAGQPRNVLLYRSHEPTIEIVTTGRPWSFDSDGERFRLVSEAYRIRLAYLFDPRLAVHTSLVEPLPHQITAVYGEMLPRQPLRFLLADDPGAGKTIMTGLFLKELLLRGDLKRCLVCCPGNLTEQWQEELDTRFHLPFEIMTRDVLESARTGNAFDEHNLIICRLDQLSRNDDLQAKLAATDWDVVVCDEAHKMSASFFTGEVKATKRYRLGQLLGGITRHFLLLTATPHNGKEEDFQLFMALLDADRFEGRFRDGVHTVDTSDLMRRMVKEQLVKFDNTPLFPERFAYSVKYRLSDLEAHLYTQVTNYVREEMNRADRLMREGEGRAGNMVGFALTVLQRRLASSPEAIYQSLKRRRERLEKRLREEELLRRGAEGASDKLRLLDTTEGLEPLTAEENADEYYDDTPAEEIEEAEEEIVDRASAARTIAELRIEIATLLRLEKLAYEVRRSGADRKWEELSKLLQRSSDVPATNELFGPDNSRHKLIIFTEHRDTLNYLANNLRTLLGRPEAVVTIDGSCKREERHKRQQAFTQNKDVLILVATDAAGEGINLQRAHLMINYDLPWNPNRIEQRFGRIHRIGQTEVCHLWNLVAMETREGDVFETVFEKIERERAALGGAVFDVLGKSFSDTSLRELLLEAIRYGDQPEVRAKLTREIGRALDRKHLLELLQERALAHETLSAARVQEIREDMERAEARRLQPHFVASFFRTAFELLGGTLREREPKRYEITHVPAVIRNRDRLTGTGEHVLPKYERITFEKNLIAVTDKPLAEFVCPGHPLLDATIDLILERHRDLLKRGAVLIDPHRGYSTTRALFYLEHAIQDARTSPPTPLLQREGRSGRVASKQMQFVEVDAVGQVTDAGYAPYLDYRPATDEERALLQSVLNDEWLTRDLEAQVMAYAIEHLAPQHLQDTTRLKEAQVQKTMAAVKERLTKEIIYWDHRATELRQQELAGRTPRLNSAKAQQRADDLTARLDKRMTELEQEQHLSALPPNVVGGTIVVPVELLQAVIARSAVGDEAISNAMREEIASQERLAMTMNQADRERIDQLAMQAVLNAERALGNNPRAMPHSNPGYDIESEDARTGRLRFIEVKGKSMNEDTVTISRTQIMTAFNKPDDFILAIVRVESDTAHEPRYVRKPFSREPDFGVVSVNYELRDLLNKSDAPL